MAKRERGYGEATGLMLSNNGKAAIRLRLIQ